MRKTLLFSIPVVTILSFLIYTAYFSHTANDEVERLGTIPNLEIDMGPKAHDPDPNKIKYAPKIYENKEYGVRLQLPAEWEFTERNIGLVMLRARDNKSHALELRSDSAEFVTEGGTIHLAQDLIRNQEWRKWILNDLTTFYVESGRWVDNRVERNDVVIGGLPAYVIVFSAQNKDNPGKSAISVWLYFGQAERLLGLNFLTEADDVSLENLKKMVDDILDFVKISYI